MVLIQLLLPHPSDDAAIARTRAELVQAFGGLTAYVQTPALGVWTSPEGGREQDQVVMIEVVAPRFDRAWWRPYSRELRQRFSQEAIHVRALAIELLDEDSA
jgi:hypothetical protein